MCLRRLRWLFVVAVFLFARTAKADNVVYVDGTYAFADNGNGIPPYGGTLNGQSTQFYCVDFAHDITGGMSWSVTITSLTAPASSFATGPTFLKSQMEYLEMAWLVTKMMGTSNTGLQAEYQYAIWSFTGGPNPYGTNASLVAKALAAVNAGFTGQGFEILTPTGSIGQEFLIYVMEPSETLMLGIGLIVLAVFLRKNHVVLSSRN